jgi:uncharacterized protein YjaG (DUF416 family)
MLEFQENSLLAKMQALSQKSRMAFALAASNRLLKCFDEFASEHNISNRAVPRLVAARLWEHLVDSRELPTNQQANEWLVEVMDLMPQENHQWSEALPLAEDAIASLAYVLRCLISGKAEEAAWAARRAYEAADQYAIQVLGLDLNDKGTEATILAARVVQQELIRQERDLLLTEEEQFDVLYETANRETLLDDVNA